MPFHATAKEVRQLFQTFGSLEYVRIPQKPFSVESGAGSSNRGFAFVNFTEPTSANKAMEALKTSTHLYGRRLVLEFEENESSLQKEVEGARKKAKLQVYGDNNVNFVEKIQDELN